MWSVRSLMAWFLTVFLCDLYSLALSSLLQAHLSLYHPYNLCKLFWGLGYFSLLALKGFARFAQQTSYPTSRHLWLLSHMSHVLLKADAFHFLKSIAFLIAFCFRTY